MLSAIRRRRQNASFSFFLLIVLAVWLSMALSGYCIRLLPIQTTLVAPTVACHLTSTANASEGTGNTEITICMDVHSAHPILQADSLAHVDLLSLVLPQIFFLLFVFFPQVIPRERAPPAECAPNHKLYYIFCSQLK